MKFDESRIPAHVAPMVAGTEVGSWGYGVFSLRCSSGPQEGGSDTFSDGQHVWLHIGRRDAGHQGLSSFPWWLPTGAGKQVSIIGVNCMTLG